MPEAPRTVTFGSTTVDEAQHRSARLGSRVVGTLVGVPAILCITVSGFHNAYWAFSVGESIPERITLTIISLSLTGCLAGLPVAAALVGTTYPGAARQAWSIWSMALWVSALAAVYFTATRSWALPDAPQPGTSLTWITAGIFDERQARAFFVLIIAMAGLAGSGLLLRLAVLASAESWRLGQGQAQWGHGPAPISSGTSSHVPDVLPAVAGQTPEEIFELWGNTRLRPASGRHVQGSAAYKDYQEACRLTGVEPLSLTKFGTLMTSRAARTQGQVIKTKINGNICYQGWCLVGSADDVPESREARLPSDSLKGASPVIPLGSRTRK